MKKTIKKILLVFPQGKVQKGKFRHCELPMGLAYLAAVLRSDYEIKVLDCRAKFQSFSPPGLWEHYGYSMEQIESKIREFSPDVVGISCLFSYVFPEVSRICALAKQAAPDCVTIIGGPHPTFLAERILESSRHIDFIVMGEGERTFPELLRRISRGEDFSDLPGIGLRVNGKSRMNSRARLIEDLDGIPFPARDLFPLDFYRENAVPFSGTFSSAHNAPVITSRGCTASCLFCASRNFWENSFRKRSAANVLNEIEDLVKNFGVKEIQFIDDNLTLDPTRARMIFQGIIDRKLDIQWCAPNGIAVWTLNDGLLELMRASGCYELIVAFESGSQRVIDEIIKKPLKIEQAQRMVKKMKQLGMLVNSFFIVGFPGETLAEIRQTIRFARRMDFDGADFFIANPTPGSELFDVLKERGNISDDFEFDQVEYHLPNFDGNDWTRQQLQKLVRFEFSLYLVRVLVRHPLRFFRKYGKLLFRHPLRSLKTSLAVLRK